MAETAAAISEYVRTNNLPDHAVAVIAGRWPHATADQIEAAAQAATDHLSADSERLLAEAKLMRARLQQQA